MSAPKLPAAWHEQADWEYAAAYAAGYAAGRAAEAAEWMAPFAAWLARDESVSTLAEGMRRHLRHTDGLERFAAMLRGELAPTTTERETADETAPARGKSRWPDVRKPPVPGTPGAGHNRQRHSANRAA